MKRHVESGEYDVLIVDCAPTAETLRLLSLPEIMNWYIERIWPVERKVVKAVRPLVSRVTSMPIAGENVFEAVERLHANLDAVKAILTDAEVASVRLVLNPEKMVISEARRTYTYLGLFGYRVDAIVVNRVLPPEITDPYFGKWKDIQADHLSTVHESFAPVPILQARLFDREMVGVGAARARWPTRCTATATRPRSCSTTSRSGSRKRDDRYVLTIRLPFTSRDDLDVHRRGEELFVRVRPVQAEPDPAADPQADGGARGELRRGAARDRVREAGARRGRRREGGSP